MSGTQTSSAKKTSAQIRREFIQFFAERCSHTFVHSSPVVPHDDPTLLFTNAGMNQFKPLFLGMVDPNSDLGKLKRSVNSQKCIRAGGKHNDLDDVGKDLYHHTFFEMLGNWSFGDYFKAEAIQWSWELFVDIWGLDPERIYATYFEGNESQGLEPDLEAKELWLRYLPEDRVLPGDMKDNFWEMGDTGPCGPCSEIHYDGRHDAGISHTPGRDLVNKDDPDVIELWNLVFIQFDRQAGGLKPLPAQHVDTGMGLERICRVLQDKTSNYDTDIFTPIFDRIREVTGAAGYSGDLDKPADIAYRVIADHIRALTFAITDGADPSNEGRGYVLRRILRRAFRHGRQTLGASGPFLCELVPTVIDTMGDFFPELTTHPQHVTDVIRDEEEAFGRTLDRGIAHFAEAAEESAGVVGAEDAFKLHDTYGFPIDLTQIMAEERGLSVDVDGFHRLMEEARERSRAGGGDAASDPVSTLPTEAVASLHKMGVSPTDDHAKFEATPLRATVKAIWNGSDFDENLLASHTRPTDRFTIIVDKTCLYGEMGGQVGDKGTMRVTREARSSVNATGDPGEMIIEDTKHIAGYVLHIGRIRRGEIRIGDIVDVRVDKQYRRAVASNHTSTHLLNLSLRNALGGHVEQKGSLVAPDRLRFDFSHTGSVTTEQAAVIQGEVQATIEDDLPVHAQLETQERARGINGLRAVFGETYPDPVRVVSIGPFVDDILQDRENDRWRNYSVEFCGGTHLARTSEAETFALISEEAVAKGVRRIVALTGAPAKTAVQQGESLRKRVEASSTLDDDSLKNECTAILNALSESDVPLTDAATVRDGIEALQGRIREAKKQSAAAGRDSAVEAGRELAATASGAAIVGVIPAGSNRNALLAAMDTVRSKHTNAAILLFSPDEESGKIVIVATCSKSAIDAGLKAGDWVRHAAGACGGKGGGRPDSAQGGGTDLSKLDDAADAARSMASKTLG